MRILVDADACPVVKIVEMVARRESLPVILFCDTNHALTSDYSELRVIGAGRDAVDFALLGVCQAEDVVITQDYGLASLVLAKRAAVLHPSGRQYTDENIDLLLMERHLAARERKSKGKKHWKGPSKRTAEDDENFEKSFRRILSSRNHERLRN